jgi:hypothetical protein
MADTQLVTHALPCKAVGNIVIAVFILSRILKVRRIADRWIPHTLTDDQKRIRVQTAKQLLKMFPRKLANIVTVDETWVHYIETKQFRI